MRFISTLVNLTVIRNDAKLPVKRHLLQLKIIMITLHTHTHTKSNGNYRYGLKKAVIGLALAGVIGTGYKLHKTETIDLSEGATPEVVSQFTKETGGKDNLKTVLQRARSVMVTSCATKNNSYFVPPNIDDQNRSLRFNPEETLGNLTEQERTNIVPIEKRAYDKNGFLRAIPQVCQDQLGESIKNEGFGNSYDQLTQQALEISRFKNNATSVTTQHGNVINTSNAQPNYPLK